MANGSGFFLCLLTLGVGSCQLTITGWLRKVLFAEFEKVDKISDLFELFFAKAVYFLSEVFFDAGYFHLS